MSEHISIEKTWLVKLLELSRELEKSVNYTRKLPDDRHENAHTVASQFDYLIGYIESIKEKL